MVLLYLGSYITCSDGNNSDGHVRHIYISSVSHGVVSKRKKFCSNYVISSKEFTSEMVSQNQVHKDIIFGVIIIFYFAKIESII